MPKYFILIMMMLLMLTGCKETYNYSYLMRHPWALKKEIDRCQADGLLSVRKVEYCKIVMYAGENMLSILKQQQENPEKFGERILTIETEVAKAKVTLNDAQNVYDALKEKHAADDAVKEAKEKRDRLKKTYEDQYQEMKVMLTVIGINTPE